MRSSDEGFLSLKPPLSWTLPGGAGNARLISLQECSYLPLAPEPNLASRDPRRVADRIAEMCLRLKADLLSAAWFDSPRRPTLSLASRC